MGCHNKQDGGKQRESAIAAWQPQPLYKMCDCAEPPPRKERIKGSEQEECPRGDENDQELRCATNENRKKCAGKERDGERGEKCGVSTIATSPVAEPREEQGEQDVQEQRSAGALLRFARATHVAIVADLHVFQQGYWRLICSQSKILALSRMNEARLIPNGLVPVNPVTHTSDPALKIRAPRFPVRMTVTTVIVNLPFL